MNEEQKTLADRWVEKAKNNPFIAGFFVIATIVGIATPVVQQISKIFPSWERKTTGQGETQCKLDSAFKADVLYSDARVLKKKAISAALELYGYKGRTANTGFEEFDNPGAPGTAWVTYPSCIVESDPRLVKIIRIMKENGYSEENSSLRLLPHSSRDFPVIEISLF